MCTVSQPQAKLHIDSLGPTVTCGKCSETHRLFGAPHPATREWRAEKTLVHRQVEPYVTVMVPRT